MSGYTKLSSSLVTSTVWRESAPTRVVWITMLALADQHGEVEASIPGLADAARVTIPECEEALRVFLSPDKYSRTTDFEGRRIEAIDGGWQLLNHKKYRHLYSTDERREHTAERTRRWRERHKEADVTPCDARDGKQKQKQIQKQKQKKTKDVPPDGGSARTTWLTPAMLAWESKFGPKSFAFGLAAKALDPLQGAGLDPAEIGRRLARYLNQLDDLKFASLPRFAQTHGQYAEDRVSPQDAELQAIAEEARPEAYVNSDAVRLWESAQMFTKPQGTRTHPEGGSGLHGAIPATEGASAGVSP